MKERSNLFPNPRFSLTGTPPKWTSSSMRHSDLNGVPRLVMEHVSTGADICMWPVKLDPGAYHFQVVTWHEKPCRGCIIWGSSNPDNGTIVLLDDGVKDTRNAVTQSCDFTVTADMPWILIGFTTGQTGTVGQQDAVYWHPLLEAKSTYDMVANSGGGGVVPCTSTGIRSRSKRSGVVA